MSPLLALVSATLIWCSSEMKPRLFLHHPRVGFFSIRYRGRDRTVLKMTQFHSPPMINILNLSLKINRFFLPFCLLMQERFEPTLTGHYCVDIHIFSDVGDSESDLVTLGIVLGHYIQVLFIRQVKSFMLYQML